MYIIFISVLFQFFRNFSHCFDDFDKTYMVYKNYFDHKSCVKIIFPAILITYFDPINNSEKSFASLRLIFEPLCFLKYFYNNRLSHFIRNFENTKKILNIKGYFRLVIWNKILLWYHVLNFKFIFSWDL